MAARTLTLPAVVLEEERVRQTVFAAGAYEFDAVLPEHKIGSFQPDALVRYQGFELAVEFLVHHAVDGEKCAKVRDHDISMVEIDLSGYFPKVVDDLCGLPLEAIRRRNREAIAAAEAEKAAALERAASERQRSIRLLTGQMLEGEAAAWLAQKVAGTETSFEDYAREGDQALLRLERQLASDSDSRRQRISAEWEVAQLRGQLSEAAKRAFPSEQMAALFLNSGHPRLQGRRPIDRCHNQQDLSFIMSLMPKKR